MKPIVFSLIAAVAISAAVFLFWPGSGNAHPLRDIDGVLHGSLEKAKTEFTALFFLGTTCPISRQYAPEIMRICDDFRSNGVDCYLVFPESGLTTEDLKNHLQEFGYTLPAVMDTRHELATAAGATVTPEAAVFSRSGSLLYRGRINDLWIELGQQRREAHTHDLRDALAALAAHRNVPEPRTPAVGCYIEGL
ncbi:MAG TPA: hypothetical protein VFY29_05930 [Terriglobia bacterium]|nr:hypothetical protein [Terriglobia bacterium]